MIFLLKQNGFSTWVHPDIAFIFVFLAFQSYLTLSLAQLGQKNEGEKFVQIQTASFAIRFICSILFIAFFAYSHRPQIYLFVGNFLVVTFRHLSPLFATFWYIFSKIFRTCPHCCHFVATLSPRCRHFVVTVVTLSSPVATLSSPVATLSSPVATLSPLCRHFSPLCRHFSPLSRHRRKLAAAHIPNLLKSIKDWWTQMGRDSCLEQLAPPRIRAVHGGGGMGV